YRIKKKDGRIIYLSEVSVVHVGRASSSQLSEKMLLLQTKSCILYFSKNHGRLQGKVARALIIIGQCMRFCLFRVLSIAFTKEHEHRKKSEVYYYLIKDLICPKKGN
ncbi:hypothetical protein KKB18_11855, partial [bacterium]|nr:hypothetical protein [bacterium]